MSTQALGKRGNWWGERPIDDLRETPVGELSTRDLRRLVRETADHNLAVEIMSDDELREWVRTRRQNPDRPTQCVTDFERARWKAHMILRQQADAVSSTAKYGAPCLPGGRRQQLAAWLFDDERLEHDSLAMHSERTNAPLTDPVLHVPREHAHSQGVDAFGQYRFRRRYDPEHGYIGGVSFRDLPFAEFMAVVEDVLRDLQARHSFASEKVEGWLADARELKRDEGRSDQDVLTQVLYRVYRA